MHQKKLLAAAVAGAFAAAPAIVAAQTSTVQIGGSIHAIYGINQPNNGTAGKKHDDLHTSEPEMYIRGQENLGGGLAAWFQCTSSFDILGTAAGNSTGAGQLCGRNSGLGFKGGWGNAFVGNWDTPHKLNYNQARGWFSGTNVFGGTAVLLFNDSSSNHGNGVGNGQSGALSDSKVSFYRRQARLISYHSPSWNGFSVNAAYSAQNENTANGGNNLKPRLWSLGGNYRNGPMYFGASYERHEDFNPLAISGAALINGAATGYSSGTDDSWSIVGVYTFANSVRVSGVWTTHTIEMTNTSEAKKTGWAAYLDWQIQGPHSIKAQYGRSGDFKLSGSAAGIAAINTAGIASTETGGKVYGIDYAYDFSKRTQGYVGYNKIKNDANASYGNGLTDASAGQSQTFYGVGLRHRF